MPQMVKILMLLQVHGDGTKLGKTFWKNEKKDYNKNV
jgi:hypothetical protein